jgi:hypothetical protein
VSRKAAAIVAASALHTYVGLVSITLQAYFDGSGKCHDPQCNYLALAGYVGDLDGWAPFEYEWLSVLEDFGLKGDQRYFHMIELRKGSGPYVDWPGEKKDALLQALFNRCLGKQWGKPSLYGASCIVDLGGYRKAAQEIPGLRPPEAICVDYIVTVALGLLPEDKGSPLGVSGRVELFFDQGESFLHQINQVWQNCNKNPRDILSLISQISNANSRLIPGLQAADYSAWYANRAFSRGELRHRIRWHLSGPGYRELYDYDRIMSRYGRGLE